FSAISSAATSSARSKWARVRPSVCEQAWSRIAAISRETLAGGHPGHLCRSAQASQLLNSHQPHSKETFGSELSLPQYTHASMTQPPQYARELCSLPRL